MINNPWIVLAILLIVSVFTILILFFLYSGKKQTPQFQVKRLDGNPLIRPGTNHWESQGTFNPAAIKDATGKIHMLYRAIGDDGISRMGYTNSFDAVHFEKSIPYPIFTLPNMRTREIPENLQTYNPIIKPSGGSWSGSEDPRMVSILGRIYVTFNAFDGWDFVRVGIISIDEKDFFNKRFKWTRPFFLSPKDEVHKNWVLFPEKIDGKFAILHSINSGIQIDYVNNLEEIEHGTKIIKSKYGQKAPRETWDTWVRSAGPPPIKTPSGWLVLYHAINKKEPSRYKLGAMLLDLQNPKKVIARAPKPILTPDMWYENDWKPGIIYACGAVIRRDSLYIYYGGGDRYVCAAHTKVKPFLDWLIKYGKVS